MTTLEVKTTVPLDSYLFRSESELQGEEKGGYLTGEAQILGLDSSREEVAQIDMFLESDHPSKIHCNLLRISSKHCSQKENGHKHKKEKRNMSPKNYKVSLVRNAKNGLVLDTTDHQYLSSSVKDIDCWDETTQTLDIGKIKESIVKPLSKQDNGQDCRKSRTHIRDVLKYRKQCELEKQFTSQNEVAKHLEIFAQKELGAQSKKEKEISKNLESFLSETQNIHKAKLKFAFWLRPKHDECKGKDHWKKVEGESEWILASNLYSMTIDKKRTNIQILDNASIRLLTIMLIDCQATLALKFEAEFLYQQVIDNVTIEEQIDDEEIEIIQVKSSNLERCHQIQRVLRIGGSKTHALQFFYKSRSGPILQKVCNRQGNIILKMKMLDATRIGIWHTVDVGVIEHDCQYDKTLQRYDDLNGEIATEEKIEHWKNTGRLLFRPCSLCKYDGCHARKQYHAEAQTHLPCRGKRRSAQNSDGDGMEKRNRRKYTEISWQQYTTFHM